MKKLAYVLIVVSLVIALGQSKSFVQPSNAASATVDVLGLPALAVTKTDDLNPAKYDHVGQLVTYTLTATNTGHVTLHNVTVSDSPALDGFSCTPSVPVASLAPGASIVCTGTHSITQADLDAGSFKNTASATSTEANAPDATDTVCANQNAKLGLTKTDDLNPAKYDHVGQLVTYTLTATNTGNITLHNVTVSDNPPLDGFSCTPAIPVASLAPGASIVCTGTHSITQADLDAGSFKNTASATSTEANAPDATVTVYAKLYKLYFPIILSGVNNNWDVTVGYEDLPFSSSNLDFDYNDFLVAIHSVLTYDQEIKSNLQKVDFILTPEARGAVYDHEFHMFFAANIFASDGVATLTLFDQNHNVISTQSIPFVAGSNNNFMVFSHTSDIFPELSNTYETKPRLKPQRTAELSIEFNTPFFFNLAAYPLTDEHGSGMFFDPYLKVLGSGEQIFRGDSRMLVIMDINWMWPEENVRMDKAYPLTTYLPGPPPDVIFPNGWWFKHNTCVYGDGIPCPAP